VSTEEPVFSLNAGAETESGGRMIIERDHEINPVSTNIPTQGEEKFLVMSHRDYRVEKPATG